MADPRALRVEAWQHTCPQCGYENGFHISFRRPAPDKAGGTTGEVAVWLICPSCSALFDVGLRTRLSPVGKA
ncbi:MAG TPA: hypothetical protein VNE39_02160 [Planctomycetota bacterium]|nr:hypothetical protein [Planctomycetota bacterium]